LLAVPKRKLTQEERAQRELRARRFQQEQEKHNQPLRTKRRRAASLDDVKLREEANWTGATIRGTSEILEKDYFRLTSAPDPSTIRPERILDLALIQLKKKWKAAEIDYDYICSQLKAIRQDLTVQAIKNKFTINVYETHARIALENADLNEYNQCQTQLKELYDHFSSTSSNNTVTDDAQECCRNFNEFLAYRILYYLMLTFTATARDAAVSELRNILRNIPMHSWHEDIAVSHALQVRQALSLGNYATFFSLYASVPNMGQYILDTFVDKVRIQAAAKILKAYKLTMPLSSLQRLLGLSIHDDDDDDDDLSPTEFILQIGFKLDENDQTLINLTDSVLNPTGLGKSGRKQQNSLL